MIKKLIFLLSMVSLVGYGAVNSTALDSLGWRSIITITANPAEPLENFPMLIRIKENEAPKGFFYKYAKPDGSDIRFIYRDKEGNVKLDGATNEPKILEHEIDTWDTSGESVIWVKVPKYEQGASVTMYWGELANKEIPNAKDPKSVWRDYVAVWHMDDAEDAKNGGKGRLGTNTQQYNGILGKAYGNKSNRGGAILAATNTESMVAMNILNGNTVPGTGEPAIVHSKTLTASFWVYLNGSSSADAVLIARLNGINTTQADRGYGSDNGWGFSFRSANNYKNIRYWFKDDDGFSSETMTKAVVTRAWHRMDIIFDDWYNHNDGDIGYSSVWLDGEKVDTCDRESTFMSVDSLNRPFQIGGLAVPTISNGVITKFTESKPLNGRIDEMRVRQGTLPEAWIKADYDQVRNTCYQFDDAVITPGAIFKNRWIIEPSISKTSWGIGDEPATVIKGESLYGESYYTFTSRSSITNSIPSEAGIYTYTAQTDGGDSKLNEFNWGWSPLSSPELIVSILPSKSKVMDLGGSLSGRVLLANDWESGSTGKDNITGQNYSYINSSESSSYWVHGCDVSQNKPYLSNSTVSELKSVNPIPELYNSTMLWHLENVRIGNLYEGDGSARLSTMNYLPTIGDVTNAAHLVMRNMEESVIYSPTYTNGIGTIYFDAVNSITSTDGVGYKLIVEICTNEVDNLYVLPEWKRAKMSVMKKEGPQFAAPIDMEELPLAIANGGTDVNFYRVFIKLDYYGPIKFRIKRVDVNGVGADDGYILVDNIIASYPAIRVDIDTHGTFKPENCGKATVGVVGAFNVNFPSVKDTIIGRGKVDFKSSGRYNPSQVSRFVCSSKIYYRWRYLNQRFDRWRGVELNKDNGFIAEQPFELPKGLPGDVEYYYLTLMDAPYYEYVDYSGMDLNLGGYYDEYAPIITNRLNSATVLESQGRDWFIRLREGKSDYETIELVVSETRKNSNELTNVAERITMELAEDGVWRGIYKVSVNNVDGIKCRIEAFNKQSLDFKDWAINTNMWKVSQEWNTLPIRDLMTDATTTNDWSKIPSDGMCGCLLFQLDEKTKLISIARADYQDFNSWNDANKGAEWFVANSLAKSSASRPALSSISFVNWRDMPKDHPDGFWKEEFKTTVTQDYTEYEPFKNAKSPNGWDMVNGKVTFANYKYKNTSYAPSQAFQMLGNGLGYIELSKASTMPRGIDKIKFNARLVQDVDFEDATIYYGDELMTMSNYTFVVAGSFDSYSNLTFRGNASLSLFANYQFRKGAYEVRVEQVKAWEEDYNGTIISFEDYPSRKGQRISLYRWEFDRREAIAELIGTAVMNTAETDAEWPLSDGVNGFQPIYISVSNGVDSVRIEAGFMNDSLGVTSGWELADITGKKFKNVSFVDSSDKRLTRGTYGLLTANSEGVLVKPRLLSKPVSVNTEGNVTFNGDVTECSEDISDGLWDVLYDRMVEDPIIGGFRAIVPTEQTVRVYTIPIGSKDWELIASTNVATFGEAYTEVPTFCQFDVYRNDASAVRIEAGDDITDVLITNIEVTQFSGGDWDDAIGYVDDWVADNADGGYKNFIFTKSWIKDGAVMLSARRTTPDQPSTIRSPLYDGCNGRGIGLGMFSFKYKNAHPDVSILLQVVTNITESSMPGIDHRNDLWSTVKKWDFNNLSEDELKNGTRSCYLGLHGVSGLMRIVMDTNVVIKCQSVKDESKFPEIYITDVFTRDEPALDERAWRGWNIRTVGDDTDSEGRMYLYDLTTDLSQRGMSLALNNSVVDDVDIIDMATVSEQQPFLQTPTFMTNSVGQIEFKARQYDVNNPEVAQITLYGSKTGELDADSWEPIKTFILSETTYSTNLIYKVEPSKEYKAFRLSVAGVEGVRRPMEDAPGHLELNPARVLIDEVLVSEAIRSDISPNESSILVYANVDALVSHISQSFGDVKDSRSAMTFVVPKGMPNGTNITYKIDKWYEMDSVLTNNVVTSWCFKGKDSFGASIYEATVAVNASNNVTVVASAKLNEKLTNDYGLGYDNKYRDAVIDWLEKGESLNPMLGKWENLGSDDISLAEYQSLSGNFVTNLTLTQMYWLDIDPTASNFVFRGGMVESPTLVERLCSVGDGISDCIDSTGYRVGVKLYITNTTENIKSKYYNKAWAPYVLRGCGKGETSINYASANQTWSSATFKIMGFLNNGLNNINSRDKWVPLRSFVFNSTSFDQNFITHVEISNPFAKDSPGDSSGWHEWYLEHPNDGLFFKWVLDTRLGNVPIEVLNSENE